ncbi:MAG: long-chain-fatty-acid--CoA ligase [Planctomycetes bacterium]|nr:long-chain-fatty-acid--CoA ligase [Planctomycetota bacterium]
MKLFGMLERAAALHGRDLAVVDGAFRCDYGELRARAAALGAFLRTAGVEPGARVAILAWNGHEYLETYFAAAAAGVILCPLNVRLAPVELAAILADAGVEWIVADTEFEAGLARVRAFHAGLCGVVWIGAGSAEAPGLRSIGYEAAIESARGAGASADRALDDVAQLYYTSGTTGRAKGVMLSQRNVSVHALGAIAELGLEERDRWAHIAPMFHLADAWATFAITWAGGVHVFLRRFEARAALELLEEERVTITNLVPTMLNLMLHDPSARGRDWSSLRRILSGGAPIASSVVREIVTVFGCEYVQTYGMTETSPFLTLSLPPRRRTLAPEEELRVRCKTGRPFATIELRVVDASGRDVSADDRTVGEIWVRGETVTRGYWNQPEETRAAFTEGWLRTGDLATLDGAGYVTIVDRMKDMILTGGENVYSTEVEHALYAHPAVLEAAVFGVADARWGEAVCAAVVVRSGAKVEVAALLEHCGARLARYKVPRHVEFLAELPRTGSGKITKRLLRERFLRSPLDVG